MRISSPNVTIRSINSYDTWHQRLGHPHDRLLRAMTQSNMVLGLPDRLGPTTPCETCAKAKSKKSTAIGPSFRHHDRVLHLVVAVLCGPFQERSVGGAQYFIQIRDVFSTFVRVLPLVNKYDATSVIKNYIAEVERLTGEKILYWRNDGGGEFLNKSLETFFTEKGISLEKTLRYHHKQAGIIERSQRTVQSIMQCLLFGSDLPKSFWSLAATTAAYLHNRIPNGNTGDKTPQEILLNEKPNVDHLRVFGSWVYVHIPQELRKKLDERAVKCRFVGYLARSKGWKFWNPLTNEFLESAHARWLDESANDDAPVIDQHPVPDPPSNINKLLNLVEFEGTEQLIEALRTSLVLDDQSITATVREQDVVCNNVRLLAAGIAQKLPRSYKLAMKGDESEEWRRACDKEISMLRKMKVWEEVDLPAGKQVVSSKWVFNKKSNSDGVVTKYKSWFVVQGFSQEQGVDFNETFAPTARFSSLMILFAIKVKNGWIMKGFDVGQHTHIVQLKKKSTSYLRTVIHARMLQKCCS